MVKSVNTIAEQVYSAIRTNIISLKIVPGTAMSEKEIGEKLSVSRTPVREAFIRLEKEGLVRILPQRGTYVSKISIGRAKEERFLRESVEIAVLRDFMKKHTEESVLRLAASIEKQKKAMEEKAWDKFMRYDDQFHEVLYQETNKMLCNELIKYSTVDYYRLRCLSVLISGGIAMLNVDQHTELLACIRSGSEQEASELLMKHLRKVFTEMDEMQEKYPEYFLDSGIPCREISVGNLVL